MARLRFQIWLDIRDISAEVLAARVGVSNQAVNRWLSHGIPAARVDAVAAALRIRAEELQPFVDNDIDTAPEPVPEPTTKRPFSRRLNVEAKAEVETESANSSASNTALKTNGAQIRHKASDQTAELPKTGAFADRRTNLDRRRQPTLAPGTPSRRLTQERRDTSYTNTQGNYWWLKVDYLDRAEEDEDAPLLYLPAQEGFREVTVDEASEELAAQLTGTNSD